MDQLIPVVAKLHDVLDAIGPEGGGALALDLPCIVVVGCQSSGKSSVLEALVQRDFLPRGRDIVTRRPLVLQLVHVPAESAADDANGPATNLTGEWAEFGHLPGTRLTDFLAVRREIEDETARVAGPGRGISRAPIHLRIFSPHVLSLTLIDLPGITKIPVGEQPADIEAVVRQLVLEYACRPNAIILAVTPANADLANSDALKIAREADPDGTRTLGVLTKLDLMDAGTHAADILAGRSAFRLRLGFVGVVCRSQHDINVGKPIRDALRHEAEFFRSHAHYRAISHRCGSVFLARELNRLLLRSIREQLPELRTRINALILETQTELGGLGDALSPSNASPSLSSTGAVMLRLLTLYVSDFNEALQGTSRVHALCEPHEPTGGARISRIFNEIYASAIAAASNTDGLSLVDVRAAIRNASGPRPSLFVPEASFEVLARKQIARLEAPAQKCADLVYDELGRMLHRVADGRPELRRFPALAAKVVCVAADLLRERLAPTLAMIEALVRIEMAYINTSHPDFCRAGAPLAVLARIVEQQRARVPEPAVQPAGMVVAFPTEEHAPNSLLSYIFRGGPQPPGPAVMPPKKAGASPPAFPATLGDKEELETQLIMSLLSAYLAIVRKNIADSVPKAVMHLMVNALVEQLPTRLVTEIYREELFAELVVEDEAVVRQRTRTRAALDAYRQAAAILADLSTSSSSISI